MKFTRALGSGLLGGAVAVIVFCAGAWLLGADSDICALFGAVLVTGDGEVAWSIGCLLQLGVAAIVGLVYASVFEWVTRRSGMLVGLSIAIPHVIVAGLAMSIVPVRAGNIGVEHPGAFLEYRGAMAIAVFVVAHLFYGITVGVTYGRPRHSVPAAHPLVWEDVSEAPREALE
jgi:uncharacterized membrane protein